MSQAWLEPEGFNPRTRESATMAVQLERAKLTVSIHALVRVRLQA